MTQYGLRYKKYWFESDKDKENARPMLTSKCAVCGNETSRFIKEQEAKGLLSSLALKTPFNKNPLLGDI